MSIDYSSLRGGLNSFFLRKEKQLNFNKSITKIQDLTNPLLAACLAKVAPGLTEQALFQCGGELAEAGLCIMVTLLL